MDHTVNLVPGHFIHDGQDVFVQLFPQHAEDVHCHDVGTELGLWRLKQMAQMNHFAQSIPRCSQRACVITFAKAEFEG